MLADGNGRQYPRANEVWAANSSCHLLAELLGEPRNVKVPDLQTATTNCQPNLSDRVPVTVTEIFNEESLNGVEWQAVIAVSACK